MSDTTVSSLDAFVEAFENALAPHHRADLADFLPDIEHPLHRTILRELVRIDLEWGWTHGQPTSLEEYCRRFPHLFDDAVSRQEITFEEYRLRRQAGEAPSPAEYEKRYGVDTARWPRSAVPDRSLMERAALDYRQMSQLGKTRVSDLDAWCQSIRGDAAGARFFRDLHSRDPSSARLIADAVTALPEAGGSFLGFHLEAELGRGAFGRVFLARQAELSDRLVALKITPDVGGESQTLAQLQHTHIVPVYSVHRTGPLQGICMPYFGRTTLADVLHDLSQRSSRPLSGIDLLSSLSQRHDATLIDPGPVMAPPAHAVTLRKLEGRSYTEGVLWLGACLADGLAHAHERGILHRDLKPANVLLTDEGQPMLLDFNLSEDMKLRGTAVAAHVGGTLPYMAVEQLEAFAGKERTLDARTDVFALGLILYELLAGRPAFRRAGDGAPMPMHQLIGEMIDIRSRRSEPVRRWNRAVSPAVDAILARCLEPDRARRYENARQLQEDLERQLEHRPLRFTPEPSLRERVRKWVRSNPRLLGRLAIAGACVAVLVALGLGVRAWSLGQTSDALSQLQAFSDDAAATHDLLNTQVDDPAALEQGLDRGSQALARSEALDRAAASLSEPDRDRLHREEGKLLLLLARATAQPRPGSALERQRLEAALLYNGKAQACYPNGKAPAAVWLQRADLLWQLGDKEEAQRLQKEAREMPPQTAEDYFLLAREHAAAGRHREAIPLLQDAVRSDPRHFWAQLQLGASSYELGDDALAATSFSVCIALAPGRHEPYFNRGLVAHRQRAFAQAKADFDAVIRLNPDLADAYVNRGLALQGLRDYKAAVADFTQALEHGVTATRVYFMRARARDLAGDREGAARDREEGLNREPGDEKSWVARGIARMRTDAKSALADFDRALELNPRSRSAMMSKAEALSEHLARPAESIGVLDRVLELYPDHAPAWSGRGVLHARLKDRDAAVRDATEALKRSPSPMVRYQVACIYALAGQTAQEKSAAVRHLTDALRLGFGGNLLGRDPDLDSLRNLPEFKRLEQLVALQAAASH